MYLTRNEFLAPIKRCNQPKDDGYLQFLQWLESAGLDNISKITSLSITVEDILTERYNEGQRKYVTILAAYLQDLQKYLRADQVSWPGLLQSEVKEKPWDARWYATHQAIFHHAVVPGT